MKRTLWTGALAMAGIVGLIVAIPEPKPPPASTPAPEPVVEKPPPPRVAIAEEAVPSFERGRAILEACEAERHRAGLDIAAHRARLREAIAAFDESATLCKFHGLTYWLRGRAWELLGEDGGSDFAEARRWGGEFPAFPVPTSLETARHDVPLLRDRGEARLAAGDLDGAREDFELIVELTEDPTAFERIGEIERRRAETEGRNAYVRGLLAANEALSRGGWTFSRLRLRAELNEGMGFRSEAVLDLKEALKLCSPGERAAIEARLAELEGPR